MYKIEPAIYKLSIIGENIEYCYFGQTQKLQDRKAEHLRELKKNKHGNVFMQKVYNKYKNIKFEKLEDVALEHLDEREQYYLDIYHGRDYCMNILPYARSTRGRPRNEEIKRKISKNRTGKDTGWDHKGSRPVCLIINEIEHIFSCAKEAAIFLGVKKHNMYNWLNKPSSWPREEKRCKQLRGDLIFKSTGYFLDVV